MKTQAPPRGRIARCGETLVWVALISGLSLGPHVARAASGQSGAIRGAVYDADFQLPLSGVRVSVAEAPLSVVTKADGTFLIERVPTGAYTLSFVKEGYDRQVRSNVVVIAAELADLRVELSAEVIDLDELIVTGGDLLGDAEIDLLEIRTEAVQLQDAISSELMGKAGVGDVASAAKLVVGTTVVDGKYVTVRGMSDRYTGTTLNGVRVPSADPRRRAVQVDQFPTGTLESLTVTKTFTPDLQGDFTGGGVDIRTKSVPDGAMLSYSASTEYDTNATNNGRFLTYAGGGVDFLGFDRGGRDLPDGAGEPLPAFTPASFPASEEKVATAMAYDRLARVFTPTMGVRRNASGLNQSYSLVGGNRFPMRGGGVFGLIGALTQSHKFDYYENGAANSGRKSDPAQRILIDERADSKGTDELLLGALVTLVARPSDDHELALSLIYNQAAEDTARFQNQDQGGTIQQQNQTLHYIERSLGSAQLRGEHELGIASLNWAGSFSYTSQEEPDVRFFRNMFETSQFTSFRPSNSSDAQNTQRIWRDGSEVNLQGSLDASVPFTQGSDSEGRFKGGLFVDHTDREFDQISFMYVFAAQSGSLFNPAKAENELKQRYQGTSLDDLWTDVFTNPDRLGLATNRCAEGDTPSACAFRNQLLWYVTPVGSDVNYAGAQSIDALYGMVELPLAPDLKLIGGARYEKTDLSILPETLQKCQNQSQHPDSPFCVRVIELQPSGARAIVEATPEEAAASIQDSSFLPSIGLVYELVPEMNLRGSWSRTIARPTFRELAPVATAEFIFGDEFIGNPDLVLSEITNYDLRWEWFRGPGEVLSVSLFKKEIADPIEVLSFSADNRSFVQPVNFESGEVLGYELEARTSPKWLPDVVVGMNLTGLDSTVDVPLLEQQSLASFGLQEEKRRLQGQPEFAVNLDLAYDNPRTHTAVALFYNAVGETLRTGAARGVEDGIPNVFESPTSSLDLTFSQGFGDHLTLSFKARNLLQDAQRSVYRGPDGDGGIKSERETATRFSLGLGVKW